MFNDPKLDKNFNEVKDVFKNYKENLNKLSADIKNLEKYLSDQNINEEFSYLIALKAFDREMNVKDIISWNKVNGKFRLCYIRQYVSRDNNQDEVDTPDIKPLIEAPLNIRKESKRHLDQFLLSFASFIHTEEIPNVIKDPTTGKYSVVSDEIPF